MSTPSNHLPLGVPRATSISSVAATAQYHAVYLITMPKNSPTANHELILRISGNHLPTIKTENEVAVVAYDSTFENPIAHEYTLLSRLIDFIAQLQAHEFNAIGGLHLNKDNERIEVGRIVDETFWQTVDSLNIGGPYATYVDLISAQVSTYIRLIQIHDKLAFMRDAVPELERFLQSLSSHTEELNRVKLRLSHKDLHFANILYDASSGEITAILDWGFSGVVPFTKWDPRRAFLWNARRLQGLFESCCAEKGIKILEDAAYASPLQQNVVQDWKAVVLENVAKFP
ncbi:kinase-like protein [Xylariaceae sp. AK1471]|nr:kinase-like protein [Xylariaceae sp. AK1471]